MMADTTFLVDLARGDAGARAMLAAIESSAEALRVPAPAVAKLWEAIARSRRTPREVAALQELLVGVPGAPFDARHAIVAGRLLADAAAQERGLDAFDAMVAAVAVVEDEALVTRNARDYEAIPGLRLRTY